MNIIDVITSTVSAKVCFTDGVYLILSTVTSLESAFWHYILPCTSNEGTTRSHQGAGAAL